MKLFECLDEYKAEIHKVKKSGSRKFTNLFFSTPEITNYILQKRLWYEECKFGIVIFLDEGSYYQLFLYADLSEEITIPKTDKDVCIRNIYRKSPDPAIAEQLLRNGFVKNNTSLEIQGDPHELIKGLQDMKKYRAFMERKGYRVIIPGKDRYPEVENVIKNSNILRKYHLEYRTEEEKDVLLPGSYLCIENKDHLCAVAIATITNGMAHMEDLVVEEEYKLRGLAPILTYSRMEWLIDNNVEVARGWIIDHNEESIRYHQSLGYKFTGKLSDEWVRETE